MSKIRIWLDAGHGGTDPGAVSGGLQEKEIVLDVSNRLGALLSGGFNVIYSRTDDRRLSADERWRAANAANMDYFLSIHANAGGGTGTETFFYKENSERSRRSEAFAKSVNDTFAAKMGLRNRGVKQDTQTAAGSIGVLRWTKMPAILVEPAFIDSPAQNPDRDILRNQRQEMAEALADGIYKFFGMERKAPAPPPAPPEPESDKLYRVQTGAFRNRANAEKLAAELKSKGFDAFITG